MMLMYGILQWYGMLVWYDVSMICYCMLVWYDVSVIGYCSIWYGIYYTFMHELVLWYILLVRYAMVHVIIC